MSSTQRVEVAPERLTGWVDRFVASHGEIAWSAEVLRPGPVEPLLAGAPPARGTAWRGEASDGSWVRCQGWGPAQGEWSATGPWVAPPGALLVLLVRRGGYAVAVTTAAGELLAHKVGTRHVQSRTAAGGWSQQRFARRRANQADALVDGVVGHAADILERAESASKGRVAALVTGGDPGLIGKVVHALASGPRRRLLGLPRLELRDVADPRRVVLDRAIERARAVHVEVFNA
ncbi:MAG: acVLRF1 family peptidyl-tRNA hydrolase [Ornithinimicrobium sp.]|uniref:acVLRF1 family peptidyl-tRNA hydrolase n=1 Tax=Ornithinimicrobium sp. TaxID=1977084 RepID=UPI0026DFB517|nr:acVLRF1 family peptidyl-tRNA hydrolase [Ornithinimicrobium sp.]MDO5738655.1 acVLRF1 family peptidyl-tRNA hydrolase [Ornithinimicrobium sp.]